MEDRYRRGSGVRRSNDDADLMHVELECGSWRGFWCKFVGGLGGYTWG